ncbi:hypothetical protein [Nocardioides albus]|uniref:Uncharacterized protein n=1 Tax=Nocardioides albus TaxID=1841 RepID=A0A7W5A9T5_9ACTN|nr:hypothetical protein [Nocardioides albus]MBB3092197.1 hypothetical protein [Nocardioides albus]GGU46376.1 hypothetical protein GCM10007979_51950 [Nocardioides albus]
MCPNICYGRAMLTPVDLGGAFMFSDSGTVIPVSEARDKLTELIATTKQGRVPVIGRYREPGAALVAPEIVRLLPQLLGAMARETGHSVGGRRRRTPDEKVYMLGDPWPFVAAALWMNGHRAMFAQFASDTLDAIQEADAANDLPRMTVEEFLEAMPMTLGGDLPDEAQEAVIDVLKECLPTMNPTR